MAYVTVDIGMQNCSTTVMLSLLLLTSLKM